MTVPASRRTFLRHLAMAAVAGVVAACAGSKTGSTTSTSAATTGSTTSLGPSATTTAPTVPTSTPGSSGTGSSTTQSSPESSTTEPVAEADGSRIIEVAPGELAAAVIAAVAGDELRLLAGRHRGVIDIAGVSGADGSPIVISADDGAVMQGCMLRFVNAAHWEMRGLSFEGRLVAAAAVWLNDGRTGVEVGTKGSCSNISLLDCSFKDIRRGEPKDTHAIRIDGGAESIIVKGCVSDTTSADAVQIQRATDVVIEDCHFFVRRPFPADDPWDNTGENGIDIKQADDVVVRGCVIEGFQAVDSENIESTSAGAEGIVVHKFGVVGLLVEDCTFRANRTDIKITGRTKLSAIPDVNSYDRDGRWSRDLVVRGCRFVGGPDGHDQASFGAEVAILAGPGNLGLLRHIDAPSAVPEIVVENCTFEGSYAAGPIVERTTQEFKGRVVRS
ncbi:MAG: right-handed parallel beta-helix repeat-containing protein [Actinomycetota bacterium]|nr:right-handed parallel beta-helix repeat-containing protein [Actinomycetota bacterium]